MPDSMSSPLVREGLKVSGNDAHDGRPIRAGCRLSDRMDRGVRWEQGFSADGGANREANGSRSGVGPMMRVHADD